MYIPKNRITTNLYTRGEEYKIAATGVPYTGYYWEMYNGTIFTGKNPNDKPSEQLIIIEDTSKAEKLTEQNVVFQQYTENYDAEVVPNQYQNIIQTASKYNKTITQISSKHHKNITNEYFVWYGCNCKVFTSVLTLVQGGPKIPKNNKNSPCENCSHFWEFFGICSNKCSKVHLTYALI